MSDESIRTTKDEEIAKFREKFRHEKIHELTKNDFEDFLKACPKLFATRSGIGPGRHEDMHGGLILATFSETKKAWKGEGLGSKGMKPDIIIREGREVKEIIDVKYKTKDVTTGDLYQIGFYMHEYGKDNKDPDSIKRAFAIMPKYPGAKEGSYTATKTRKVVHVKRIDVNDCVEKIKVDNTSGLRKIVNSLIQE